MRTLARSLATAALGAAAMYLLDPAHGRRRRASLRDQLARGASSLDDAAGVTWRDTRNRLRGVASNLPMRASPGDVDDPVLVERVRAHLGRAASHPKAVHVLASEGHITLQGAILEHERDAVLAAVRGTPGVREVVDRLHGFASPNDIPSLQGGRERRQLPEWRQANWSPAMRLLAGLGGLSFLVFGASRRSSVRWPVRWAALTGASALLLRSARNEPLRETQRRALHGAIDVEKTITIDAPIEQVFATMSHYENFPQFMRNVRSVELRPDGASHWRVAGPAGVTVEWDAETTHLEPNRLLAWRSLPGSTVRHEGVLRFEPVDGRGTRVTVRMRYRPPAGALGHAGAKLFGADAQSELDEDLLRLKTTLETGTPPRDAAARTENARNVSPGSAPIQ